jgi:hypothetical protein
MEPERSGSERLVVNPDITPFSGYVRVAGKPGFTARKASMVRKVGALDHIFS